MTSEPYRNLAAPYDAALGQRFFLLARDNFEKLAKRYRFSFRAAADLGCGTGLFARHLAATRGIPVFAVDFSRAMLKVAARNCRGVQVKLLQQDLRSLQLPVNVDLITANFDTLNHLVEEGDLRRAFERIRVNLNPRGHLFFDIITNCRPLGRADVQVKRYLTARHSVRQHIRWNAERDLLSTVVTISPIGAGEPAIESYFERAYSPTEITTQLTAAGFIIRGMHDAATLRPLASAVCPPRIIVIAKLNTAI